MSDMVDITDIVTSAGTQMRTWLNTMAVEDYAELMRHDVEFDPVELYRVEDGRLILTNGFHRVAAAKKAGRDQISATITNGTLQQAIWVAVAANKTNGVRRNPEDIRKAIEAALTHPNGAAMSDRQIAEYVGCSHPTVGSVRAKLVATGKLSSGAERTGRDGRTINTEKIGLKHQLENWIGLIYKPWMKDCKGDIRLIKFDGRYLNIAGKFGGGDSVLAQRYHLNYQYFGVRGGENGYGVIVDESYVRLFEAHGLKVEIFEFKDLDKPMQSIAKGAFNANGYHEIKTLSYIPVPADLIPDSIAAKRIDNGTRYLIGRVVGRADSFIHVRCAGETSDQIWFGEQLVSVEKARKLPPGLHELGYGQIRNGNIKRWIDAYWAYREMYAPDGVFVAKSYGVAAVALGADAHQLAGVSGAVVTSDPVIGDVTVLLNVELLKTLGFPVVAMPVQDAEFERAWRAWVAQGRSDAVTPMQNVEAQIQQQPTSAPVSAAGITQTLFNALRLFKSQLLDQINTDDDELEEAYIPTVQLLAICAEALGFDLDEDFEVV